MRPATTLLASVLLAPVGLGQERARPLPEKVAKAWQDAGTKSGRSPAFPDEGFPTGDPFREKSVDAVGQLPAVRVDYRYVPNPNGGGTVVNFPDLSQLPVPEVPFALYESGWSNNGGRHRQLARFTTLELLNCSCSQMSEEKLADLAALKNLRSLNLSMTSVSWGVPEALTVFPKLTHLSIYGTQYNDRTAGLVVEKLPRLQALNIGAGPLTDEGLRALSKHKSLRHLHIESTKVTDDGLRGLTGLELRTLNLGRTAVTDDGLKHIGGVKNLESLLLYGTAVTNKGVAELVGLAKLRQLNLHVAGRIGADGLAAVCKMTGLEELGIRLDPGVGAEALLGLARLTKLRHLTVNHPKLNAASIQRLQKAMPECQITWWAYD